MNQRITQMMMRREGEMRWCVVPATVRGWEDTGRAPPSRPNVHGRRGEGEGGQRVRAERRVDDGEGREEMG